MRTFIMGINASCDVVIIFFRHIDNMTFSPVNNMLNICFAYLEQNKSLTVKQQKEV